MPLSMNYLEALTKPGPNSFRQSKRYMNDSIQYEHAMAYPISYT